MLVLPLFLIFLNHRVGDTFENSPKSAEGKVKWDDDTRLGMPKPAKRFHLTSNQRQLSPGEHTLFAQPGFAPYTSSMATPSSSTDGGDSMVVGFYASLPSSKTTASGEDNFGKSYQAFNATLFHSATKVDEEVEGFEERQHPYPPFPAFSQMLHTDDHTLHRTLVTPSGPTTTTEIVSVLRKERHSSPLVHVETTSPRRQGLLASTQFVVASTRRPPLKYQPRGPADDGGGLSPSRVITSYSNDEHRMVKTLTSRVAPLSLDGKEVNEVEEQPALLVEQEEYPEERLKASAGVLRPWERQRSSLEEEGPVEKQTTGGSGAADNNELVPFSAQGMPAPGGQFYVDQHVSYGHYGRELDNSNTTAVVYDPNVLQSRYGYKGFLTPTSALEHLTTPVGTTATSPPTSSISTESSSTSAKPTRLSNRAFLSPSVHPAPAVYRPRKKIRKPWRNSAYGVEQKHLLSPAHSFNGLISRMSPINVANQSPVLEDLITTTNAVYFPIPPPVKLTVARAVLVELQGTNPTHRAFRRHRYYDRANPLGGLKIWRQPTAKATTTFAEVDSAISATTAQTTMLTNTYHSTSLLDKGSWLTEGTPPAPPEPPALPEVSEETSMKFESYYDELETYADKMECLASEDTPSERDFDDLPERIRFAVSSCFKRAKHCLLHYALPLERRISYGEDDCIELCARHPQCVSLSYSKSSAECDVFNVRNGTQRSKLSQYHDSSYYEPNPPADTSISECWQTTKTEDSWEIGLEHLSTQRQRSDKGEPERVIVDSTDVEDEQATHEILNESGSRIPASATPQRDMCPTEKDIIVLKTLGHQFRSITKPSSQNSVSATALQQPLQQYVSETECIFSCLVNMVKGKGSFDCGGLTYDTGQGECALHSTESTRDLVGNSHIAPDSFHNYYEKTCIQMELVELCKGYPIVRYPQKVLLGFAIVSRQADSFVECLEICFSDRLLLSGSSGGGRQNERRRCRSVMYFHEERKGANCILNFESKETASAYFVDENEVSVDYASFEGCFHIEEGLGGESGQRWEGLETASGANKELAVLGGVQKSDTLRRAPPASRSPITLAMATIPATTETYHPRANALPAQFQHNLTAGGTLLNGVLQERMVSPPKARHPPTIGPLPFAGVTVPAEAVRLSEARRRWRQDHANIRATRPGPIATTTKPTTTPTPVERRSKAPSLRKISRLQLLDFKNI